MPRVKKKFRADEIVVCIESFVTNCLPESPNYPVPAGTRLLGKHPIVSRCRQFFVADGTPHDEVASLRAAIYMDAEAPFVPPPQPDRTRIEQRIPDEDALVDIYNGERAHRKSETAKLRPERYVPVVPPGLDRRDALLARSTMSLIGDDGQPTRTVYRGQWVHRDDPLTILHPHAFELPPPAR